MNELRQINIFQKRKDNTRDLIVGDVALIMGDQPAARIKWRIGKVLQHVKGRDGQARRAKLKVLSKEGKQSEIYRPFQKLIPFEIVTEEEKVLEGNEKENVVKGNADNCKEMGSNENEQEGDRRIAREKQRSKKKT